MKPGGWNAKGSQFERDMCRHLSEWVTGRRDPPIFWRSTTSGGMATTAFRKGRRHGPSGDIINIRPEGELFIKIFCPEMKFRKSYSPWESILKLEGNLLAWWDQTKEAARRDGRIPLLIFKQNDSATYLCFGRQPPRYHEPERRLKFLDREGMEVCMSLLDDWLDANAMFFRNGPKRLKAATP